MAHATLTKDQQIQRLSSFIRDIGIDIKEGAVSDRCFLPGVEIVLGSLIYDPEQLLFPGDLLHEAGHIALIPAGLRDRTSGNVNENQLTDGGEEMAVMLWTYAACRHMDLDPGIVFHSNGYKGDSEWLLDNYNAGTYIALPLLQWMGLCAPNGQSPAFPHMLKWLRD